MGVQGVVVGVHDKAEGSKEGHEYSDNGIEELPAGVESARGQTYYDQQTMLASKDLVIC